MIYKHIEFEQVLANSNAFHFHFIKDFREPLLIAFSSKDLSEIKQLYSVWNGKLIDQDFSDYIEAVDFFNKTMVKERLRALDGNKIVDCYIPIITETPEEIIKAIDNE